MMRLMSQQEATDEGFVDFDAQLRELAVEVERLSMAPDRDAPAAAPSRPGGAPTSLPPTPVADPPAGPAGAALEKLGSLLAEVVRQLERKNALEGTNERLFDALHREMKSYRDGFLFDALQRPFILDLIVLLDQLGPIAGALAAAGAPVETQAQNLENAIHFLREILHRLGVSELDAPGTKFDKRAHRVVGTRPAGPGQASGEILEVRRAGYGWKDRVIRPMEVVVARAPEAAGPPEEVAPAPDPLRP